MKTSQVLITSFVLALSFSQIGCSAKIEGGGDAPPLLGNGPQSGGFDVATLNGAWKTGCVLEKAGFTSESTLELTNGAFKNSIKIYNSTSKCEAASLMQSDSAQGVFKVIQQSKTEAGSYEVQLEIARTGYTEIQDDLVRLENGKLYLGDHSAPANGPYPSKVDTSKPFQK